MSKGAARRNVFAGRKGKAISQSALAKSLRGILHCVQDDRVLWVNIYIITFAYVYTKPRQIPVGAFKEDTGEKAPRLTKKQKNIGQLADLPKLTP